MSPSFGSRYGHCPSTSDVFVCLYFSDFVKDRTRQQQLELGPRQVGPVCSNIRHSMRVHSIQTHRSNRTFVHCTGELAQHTHTHICTTTGTMTGHPDVGYLRVARCTRNVVCCSKRTTQVCQSSPIHPSILQCNKMTSGRMYEIVFVLVIYTPHGGAAGRHYSCIMKVIDRLSSSDVSRLYGAI